MRYIVYNLEDEEIADFHTFDEAKRFILDDTDDPSDYFVLDVQTGEKVYGLI